MPTMLSARRRLSATSSSGLPGDLDSLSMIVVGAEKCPPSLYERCKALAPHATLLEGYGITECSPVVAVNHPARNRPGTVGQPLSVVEVQVVDLETETPLPRDTLGMLWVSGPTIFPGYIGFEGPSPFRERDGKRWYVTGDLAEVSADNFIKLAGRLKRFLKAAGEMISLPALEEPFMKRFPPTEEGPRVAVEGVETDGGRRIVLFSTEPIALAEANTLLMQEGFRGVMRLDEVRRVDKIPVLGTGKTDYKALRAMLPRRRRGVNHASRSKHFARSTPLPFTGSHRSPTLSMRLGVVRIVKRAGSSPRRSSLHFSGADTVAPGHGRAE